MNNLQKCLNIWGDLDSSFEQSGFNSKIEYLKYICDYREDRKDSKTSIGYIIKKIRKDAAKYSEEELTAMSLLITTLEGIDNMMNNSKFETLVDVDTFEEIMEAAAILGDKSSTITLPTDFLENLKINNVHKQRENSLVMDVEEVYNAYNCIGNCVVLNNGKFISVQAKNTEDFYGLYNLELAGKDITKGTPFYKTVGRVCANLNRDGKLEEGLMFFGAKYYNVSDGNINIKIGNLDYSSKIYSYHKVKTSQSMAYLIQVPTKYGKMKIVLV